MTALASLRGSVTVEIEGVDRATVATFEIPIAVLTDRDAGGSFVATIAAGTPEAEVRAAILTACREAADLAFGNIPTAETEIAADPDPEG